MQRKFKLLALALSALIISFGSLSAIDNYNQQKKDQAEIMRLESDKSRLHEETKKLEQKSQDLEQHNAEQLKQLEEQKKKEEQYKQEIERLKVVRAAREKQRLAVLSSKKVSAAVPKNNAAPAASGDVKSRAQAELVRIGQGHHWNALDYIFSKESSWNPTISNGRGCIGLGQSCPGGSGLARECPNWRTDVECQVRHFTGYANRYGGWAGAYAAWLTKKWW